MDKIRTVSDTKRNFYAHHNRPINSIYRRVVEELMVEMHLLSVNAEFRSDPIYHLGVVTAFERFMQGYRPEADKKSIFAALCQSVGGDPQVYRHDAEQAIALAKQQSSAEALLSWFKSPPPGEELSEAVAAIANNSNFKYSRLFAIGLYTLLETADPEVVKDEKQRNQALEQLSETLHLPAEKLKKDLDLHRSNLEKMDQLLLVLKDALEADRKKRQPKEPTKQENGAS